MKAEWQKRRRMAPAAAESKPVDLPHLAAILGGFEAIEFALVFDSAREGVVRAGSDLDLAVSLGGAEAGSIDRACAGDTPGHEQREK